MGTIWGFEQECCYLTPDLKAVLTLVNRLGVRAEADNLVRRPVPSPRRDNTATWIKVVAVKVVRSGWILHLNTEPSGFAERMDMGV